MLVLSAVCFSHACKSAFERSRLILCEHLAVVVCLYQRRGRAGTSSSVRDSLLRWFPLCTVLLAAAAFSSRYVYMQLDVRLHTPRPLRWTAVLLPAHKRRQGKRLLRENMLHCFFFCFFFLISNNMSTCSSLVPWCFPQIQEKSPEI